MFSHVYKINIMYMGGTLPHVHMNFKASTYTHGIKQASTSVFLLHCANLSQVIVMILCVMRGPVTLPELKITAGHRPLKISVHFNQMSAQATSFQSYMTTCMV